jgi:thioredoxin reductase (NADPH)
VTDDTSAAFPRLTRGQIEALSRFGTLRHLHDGEDLFRSGDPRGGVFVVLSGALEIVDRSGAEKNGSGRERIIAVHGPGEFTGDIDVLARRRSVVGAKARGETEVLGIPSSDIRRIVGEWPDLGDTLLRAFIARRELLLDTGFTGLHVFGKAGSQQAFRLREFLLRNQVPFKWTDVETEPDEAEWLERFGVAEKDLPVVMFGSRPVFRNPDLEELARVIGLRRPFTRPSYDLVVIGAGPAGLAAAVYGSSEGLATLVLDGFGPGGQAGASSRIENYLGFPTGISGGDLTARATLQAQKFGAEFAVPAPVLGLGDGGTQTTVELAGGDRVAAACVLIATGAEYRRLEVPDPARFDGRGVYYAATRVELDACAGTEVVVVGGGNSAGQAVMVLAPRTPAVRLLLRGGDLRQRMSSYLAGRIENAPNVEVLYRTEIRRLLGTEVLDGIEVENTGTGETRTIATPAVFVFIGAVPCTRWLQSAIATDANGFIRTGRSAGTAPDWPLERPPFLLETSRPGVFAAGDVRLGSVKRVSSAVGEGAMAVQFVHEYLSRKET